MDILKACFMLTYISLAHFSNAQELAYPCPNDSSIVRMKGYYHGYGKIFNKEHEANRDFFGNTYQKPFTEDYRSDYGLSRADLIRVESILLSRYHKVMGDENVSPKRNSFKKARRNFKHYYRQYFGFLNNRDEIVVHINLLNFKNSKRANDYFPKWDQVFFRGFGRFYELNSESFIVNLTKGELERN